MIAALIQFNPNIFSWARARAGVTSTELSKKLKISEEIYLFWESGQKAPTFKQAQKVANLTYIPFGYLYLEKPPKEVLPIPDLRTVGNRPLDHLSINLLHTIRDSVERQLWYKEYRMEHSSPLPIVGSLSNQTNPLLIVKDMKCQMGLPDVPLKGSWDDYMNDLHCRIENLRILVIRSSMVGSNR